MDMKRIILAGILVISGLSFARDYTYNEMRDIVKPAIEQQERLSRETTQEWQLDKEETEENFEIYSDFHKDFDYIERGIEKD